MTSEVERLVEDLDRLRSHVEAVREGSTTARGDLATVLHLMVGGDGGSDGYGLVGRGFTELGIDWPTVAG